MGEVKQIEIKNQTYYFYNEMINLKNFDSSLLKIGKKHYKEINIYYIGYIKIKKMMIVKILCKYCSVNTWYLLVNRGSGYIE